MLGSNPPGSQSARPTENGLPAGANCGGIRGGAMRRGSGRSYRDDGSGADIGFGAGAGVLSGFFADVFSNGWTNARST